MDTADYEDSAEYEDTAPEAVDSEAEPTTTGPDGRGKREVSTVRFPYADLFAAEEIAKGVSAYGVSAAINDLAGHMNATSTSGTFRSKVSAAHTFGLVVADGPGRLRLTDLGKSIIDLQTQALARAQAFLNVELYLVVFEEFSGRQLPKGIALESFMVSAGVAPKQASRARQAFQRSAEEAGYFRAGRDRLTRPPVLPAQESDQDEGQQGDGKEDPKPPRGLADHPLLKALWETLPAQKPFTAEQRRRFFTTLAFNIDYVYDAAPDWTFDPAAMAKLWRVDPSRPDTNHGSDSNRADANTDRTG
jgi:hypothetical protein